MMNPRSGLVLSVLALSLGACGPKNPQNDPKLYKGREAPKQKEPPPAPPRKDVSLDPALLGAAREELKTAAASKDPVLRENVMEAVRQVPDPALRPLILAALQDPQGVVRFRGALAAGEQRVAEAREALLKLNNEQNPHLRIAAVFALHRLGDTTYTHDLEETARSQEPSVRADTAFVLGMLGEQSGLKILRVLARDNDPTVRQRAWEAAWRLGDHEPLDELVGLSMSRFADDQMTAFLALAAPGDVSVREHVRAGLTAEHFETSLVAARAMGKLRSDEGYGIALQGAKSKDSRQRFLAALAFGAIGRTDAQPVLKDLLKDKDERVRVVAAAALLQLGAGK